MSKRESDVKKCIAKTDVKIRHPCFRGKMVSDVYLLLYLVEFHCYADIHVVRMKFTVYSETVVVGAEKG